MFREYAEANGLDKDFVEKVISCIIIHSDKWRMENPEELSIEQLLLMEADLLDEEWADKYNHNPMVTYKAKQFW